MIKTDFELPYGVSFGLKSGRMKFISDSRLDLILGYAIFVSNLRFGNCDFFVFCDLYFGIYRCPTLSDPYLTILQR